MRSPAPPSLKLRAGPAGLHLFDRRTGLNCLLDDVRFSPQSWSAGPRQVSVALTNACELSCAHCYAPKAPAVLDAVRVIEWLVELDRNGTLGVGFGGGEPTLHPEFAALCCDVATRTGLAVTFTTHAHRLDANLANALRGSVHFLRLSMDGVGATYETIRGRPFAEFLRHLDIARTVAPFGLNFVVNRFTVADLDSAAELATTTGASELLLLPEQPVGNGRGIDSISRKFLADWVLGYRGRVQLTVSEAGADGLPTCDPLAAERGLRAYVHIDANGVLKRSSFEASGVRIGARGLMSAVDVLRRTEESLP